MNFVLTNTTTNFLTNANGGTIIISHSVTYGFDPSVLHLGWFLAVALAFLVAYVFLKKRNTDSK